MDYFALHMTLTHHCVSTILQYEDISFKKKSGK